MQPQFTSPHTGKVALRGGISSGILLGTLQSIITIVNTFQNANGMGHTTISGTLFELITPLIWIIGLLAVGTWGGKITGKVSTGALAGLFAGLFGGLIAAFGQAIATALNVNMFSGPYGVPASMIPLGIFAMFSTIFLAVAAGAGAGALGGLIGHTISDVQPQAMQQPHPIAQPPIPVYQPPVPVYQPPEIFYGYMPQEQKPQTHYQEIEIRLPEQ